MHDAGGLVKLALQPGVVGDAEFCGERQEYRTWLSRCWGEADAPYIMFVGMNPSTAERDVDDPTIRRELAIARRLGYERYYKVNVMDYRATSPRTLLDALVRPRSPWNLSTIKELAAGADKIVMCYGVLHRTLQRYARELLEELGPCELWCLGTNFDGSPKHPLYIATGTPLRRYYDATRSR